MEGPRTGVGRRRGSARGVAGGRDVRFLDKVKRLVFRPLGSLGSGSSDQQGSALHQNVGAGVLEWPERADLVRRLIADLPLGKEAVVGDMGCGRQTMRGLLPPGWIYRPYDICKQSDDTVVCDFNVDFPGERFDLAFCLGVVEYLDRPIEFLERIARQSRYAAASYNGFTTAKRRRKQGWRNCLGFSEIERALLIGGGHVLKMDDLGDNHRVYLVSTGCNAID